MRHIRIGSTLARKSLASAVMIALPIALAASACGPGEDISLGSDSDMARRKPKREPAGGTSSAEAGGTSVVVDTETPTFLWLNDFPVRATGVANVTGAAADNVAIGRIEVSVVPTKAEGGLRHCDFANRTPIYHACAQDKGCPDVLTPAPSVAFDVAIDTRGFADGEYCIYLAINDTSGNGRTNTWGSVQFENGSADVLSSRITWRFEDVWAATDPLDFRGSVSSSDGIAGFKAHLVEEASTTILADLETAQFTPAIPIYAFNLAIDTTRYPNGTYCIILSSWKPTGQGSGYGYCGIQFVN